MDDYLQCKAGPKAILTTITPLPFTALVHPTLTSAGGQASAEISLYI